MASSLITNDEAYTHVHLATGGQFVPVDAASRVLSALADATSRVESMLGFHVVDTVYDYRTAPPANDMADVFLPRIHVQHVQVGDYYDILVEKAAALTRLSTLQAALKALSPGDTSADPHIDRVNAITEESDPQALISALVGITSDPTVQLTAGGNPPVQQALAGLTTQLQELTQDTGDVPSVIIMRGDMAGSTLKAPASGWDERVVQSTTAVRYRIREGVPDALVENDWKRACKLLLFVYMYDPTGFEFAKAETAAARLLEPYRRLVAP